MSEENGSTGKEIMAREAEEYAQMDLALEGETLIVDYSEPKFNYNGARYLQLHPEMRPKLIKLFASPKNFSDTSIGLRVNADPRAIRQVRRLLEPETTRRRDENLRLADCVMMEAQEQALEKIKDTNSAKDCMVVAGIAKDISAQLSGMPTHRIEINAKVDWRAELTHLVQEANEKVKSLKQAKVYEIEETGHRPVATTAEGEVVDA